MYLQKDTRAINSPFATTNPDEFSRPATLLHSPPPLQHLPTGAFEAPEGPQKTQMPPLNAPPKVETRNERRTKLHSLFLVNVTIFNTFPTLVKICAEEKKEDRSQLSNEQPGPSDVSAKGEKERRTHLVEDVQCDGVDHVLHDDAKDRVGPALGVRLVHQCLCRLKSCLGARVLQQQSRKNSVCLILTTNNWAPRRNHASNTPPPPPPLR